MHSFAYKNGLLYCENVNLQELADKEGTPLYVYSKHTIAFAVVFSNPETILFGYPIRRTGIEWSCLFLWNFLHLTEQFGSRSLIDAGFLF